MVISDRQLSQDVEVRIAGQWLSEQTDTRGTNGTINGPLCPKSMVYSTVLMSYIVFMCLAP